ASQYPYGSFPDPASQSEVLELNRTPGYAELKRILTTRLNSPDYLIVSIDIIMTAVFCQAREMCYHYNLTSDI
ncbi:MAG: hypothetical protein QGI25_10600, partial [Arenicellales bacterium]|nr:hypothetical protein [Arenicellales bacterium]